MVEGAESMCGLPIPPTSTLFPPYQGHIFIHLSGMGSWQVLALPSPFLPPLYRKGCYLLQFGKYPELLGVELRRVGFGEVLEAGFDFVDWNFFSVCEQSLTRIGALDSPII